MKKLKCVYEILPHDGRFAFDSSDNLDKEFNAAAKTLSAIKGITIEEKLTDKTESGIYISYVVSINEDDYHAAQNKLFDGTYRSGLSIISN